MSPLIGFEEEAVLVLCAGAAVEVVGAAAGVTGVAVGTGSADVPPFEP